MASCAWLAGGVDLRRSEGVDEGVAVVGARASRSGLARFVARAAPCCTWGVVGSVADGCEWWRATSTLGSKAEGSIARA